MLETLLRVLQCALLLDQIEVGKETDDLGETVSLKDIEELESFLILASPSLQDTHHLKAEASVDHPQHEVDDLAKVDHGVQVVAALDKSDTPSLSRDNSNRSLRVVQVVLRVSPDERAEERGLPHTGRSDDTDDDGRRGHAALVHTLSLLLGHLALLGVAVDERDMEPLLADIRRSARSDVRRSP